MFIFLKNNCLNITFILCLYFKCLYFFARFKRLISLINKQANYRTKILIMSLINLPAAHGGLNVIITGASKGLGKAIAEKFAAAGNNLFLLILINKDNLALRIRWDMESNILILLKILMKLA